MNFKIYQRDFFQESVAFADNCSSLGGTYCAKQNKCFSSSELKSGQGYSQAVQECNGSIKLWRQPESIEVIRECKQN